MAQMLAEVRPRGGNVAPPSRSRLLQRLRSANDFPVALLIAPAGYGKSVLLRQFLDTTARPYARFGLRPEHGELLSFLRGFAEALSSCAPHAGTSLAGAYERNQTSARRAQDLARWMRAHMEESFSGTIAIDDLHHGDEDGDIVRFLVELIELCKGKVSWIVASRSTSGLPVGSWLAYGDADLPIGEADLRFTLEEAMDAAGELGLQIGQNEMRNLLHITEGWPATLTFALRTSTRSDDLRNISALTREMTYRFLAEQVYNDLCSEERDLLEVAVVLPSIDIAVLERAGFDRALQMVEALRERTAFISEESPGIYHCHDLFRDFLRHQSALQGRKAQRTVKLRAARALEDSADIEHAIAAYIAANSRADILRLLEAHGFDLLERAQSDVVSKALNALDETAKHKSGCALALKGSLEAMAGRPVVAETLLRRSLTVFDNTKELSARIALRLASIVANSGKDVASILTVIESDVEQSVACRTEAASFIAAQKAVNGHAEGAITALDRTQRMLPDLDGDAARARILHKVGITYHHLGELRLAAEALIHSSEIASDLHLYPLVSRAYAVLSNLASLNDDVSTQLHYARLAAEAAEKAGDRFALQTATLQLLNAETRLGNSKNCRLLEQSIESIGGGEGISRHLSILRSVRLAWEGKFEEAQQLLSSSWSTMPFDVDRMTCGALYALCLALDGHTEDSGKVVRVIEPMLTQTGTYSPYRSRAIAMAMAFSALAEVINGRTTNANRILRRLNRETDAVCVLMRQAVLKLVDLRNSVSADSAGTKDVILCFARYDYCNLAGILNAVMLRFLEQSSVRTPYCALTSREIYVLQNLDAGRSAKDIAMILGRSVNTVRAHIANASTKLECHGQAEAVRSAKQLGLI